MQNAEVAHLGGECAPAHPSGEDGHRHHWAANSTSRSPLAASSPAHHEKQLLRNAAVATAAMAREPLLPLPLGANSEFPATDPLSQGDCCVAVKPKNSMRTPAFQMFSTEPGSAARSTNADEEAREFQRTGPATDGVSLSSVSSQPCTGLHPRLEAAYALIESGRERHDDGRRTCSGECSSAGEGQPDSVTESEILYLVPNAPAGLSALSAQNVDRVWDKEQSEPFGTGDSIKTLLHQTREVLSSFARSGHPWTPSSPESPEGSVPQPRGRVVPRARLLAGNRVAAEAEQEDDRLFLANGNRLGGAVSPSGSGIDCRLSSERSALLTPEGAASRTPQRTLSVSAPQRTLRLTTPQAIIAMAEPLGEDADEPLWSPRPPAASTVGGAGPYLPSSATVSRHVDERAFGNRADVGEDELLKRRYEHLQRVSSIPTVGSGSRNLSPAASYIAAAAEAIAADFGDDDECVEDSSISVGRNTHVEQGLHGKDTGVPGDLSRQFCNFSSKFRGLPPKPPLPEGLIPAAEAPTLAGGSSCCSAASAPAERLVGDARALTETPGSSGKNCDRPQVRNLDAAHGPDGKTDGSGKSSPAEKNAASCGEAASAPISRTQTAGRLSEVYLASLLQPTDVLLDRTAALSAAVATPELYVRLTKSFHNQSTRRDWTSDREFAYSCTNSSCNGSVPCEIVSPSIDLLPVFFSSSRHAPEVLARVAPGVAAASVMPAAEADGVLHFCYRVSLEPKRPVVHQVALPSEANHVQEPCLKCCLSVSLFPSRPEDKAANDSQGLRFSPVCTCNRGQCRLNAGDQPDAGAVADPSGAVEESIASCLPFPPSLSPCTKRSLPSASLCDVSAELTRAPPLTFAGPPAFWGFEGPRASSVLSSGENRSPTPNACSDPGAAPTHPLSSANPQLNGTKDADGDMDLPGSSQASSHAAAGKTAAPSALEAPGPAKRRRLDACSDVEASAARRARPQDASVDAMLAEISNQSFFSSGTCRVPATVYGFRISRYIAAAARDATIAVSGAKNLAGACTPETEAPLSNACSLLVVPDDKSPGGGVQAEPAPPGKSPDSCPRAPVFLSPASPLEQLVCSRDPPSRVSVVAAKPRGSLPASGTASRVATAATGSVWVQRSDSTAGVCRPDEGVWVIRQAGTGVPLAVRAAVACDGADSPSVRDAGRADLSGVSRGGDESATEGGPSATGRRRRMSVSSAPPGTPGRKLLSSGRRPASPAWRATRGMSRPETPDMALGHRRLAKENAGTVGAVGALGGAVGDSGSASDEAAPRLLERFFFVDAHATSAAEPMPTRLRRVRQMACSWFRNKKLQQSLFQWRSHLRYQGVDAMRTHTTRLAAPSPFPGDTSPSLARKSGEAGGKDVGVGGTRATRSQARGTETGEEAGEVPGAENPLGILQEAEAEDERIRHLHALARALVARLTAVAEPLPLCAGCCECLLLSTVFPSAKRTDEKMACGQDSAGADADEERVEEEQDKGPSAVAHSTGNEGSSKTEGRSCTDCSFRLGLRWREDAFAFEYFVAVCCRRNAKPDRRADLNRGSLPDRARSAADHVETRWSSDAQKNDEGGSGDSFEAEVQADGGTKAKSEGGKGGSAVGFGPWQKTPSRATGDAVNRVSTAQGIDFAPGGRGGMNAECGDERAYIFVLLHDVVQPCVFDFVSVQVAFRAVLSRLLPFIAFRDACWDFLVRDSPDFRALLSSIVAQRGLLQEARSAEAGELSPEISATSVAGPWSHSGGQQTPALKHLPASTPCGENETAEAEGKREPAEENGDSGGSAEPQVSDASECEELCSLLRRVSATPCSLVHAVESLIEDGEEATVQAPGQPAVQPPFSIAKRRHTAPGLETILRQLLFSSQPLANQPGKGANSRAYRKRGGAAAAADRRGPGGVGGSASHAPVTLDAETHSFQERIQQLLDAEAFSVKCRYFAVPVSASRPSSLKEDIFLAFLFPTQHAICWRGGGDVGEFARPAGRVETAPAEQRHALARSTATACMRGVLQRLWPGRWPWTEDDNGLPLSAAEAWEQEMGCRVLEEIDSEPRREGEAWVFEGGCVTAGERWDQDSKRGAGPVKSQSEACVAEMLPQAVAAPESELDEQLSAGAEPSRRDRPDAKLDADSLGKEKRGFLDDSSGTLRSFACVAEGDGAVSLADASLADTSRDRIFFDRTPGRATDIDGLGAAGFGRRPQGDVRCFLLPNAGVSVLPTPLPKFSSFGVSNASAGDAPRTCVNDSDALSSESSESAASPALTGAPEPAGVVLPDMGSLSATAEMKGGESSAATDSEATPSRTTLGDVQAEAVSSLSSKALARSPAVSGHSETRTVAGTGCDSTATMSSSGQPGSSAEEDSSGAESVSAPAARRSPGPTWAALAPSPFPVKPMEKAPFKTRGRSPGPGPAAAVSARPAGLSPVSPSARRRLWATDAEVTNLRDGLDFRLDWGSDCDYGNGGSSESDGSDDSGLTSGNEAAPLEAQGGRRSVKKKGHLHTFEEPVAEDEIFGLAQGTAPPRGDATGDGDKPADGPTAAAGLRAWETASGTDLAAALRDISSLRSPPGLLTLLRHLAQPQFAAGLGLLGAGRGSPAQHLGSHLDGTVSPAPYVSGGHALRPRRGSDVSIAAAEQLVKAHASASSGEDRKLGLSPPSADPRHEGDHGVREETPRSARDTQLSLHKRLRMASLPQESRPGQTRGVGLSLPAAFLSSSATHAPAHPGGYSPSSRGTTSAPDVAALFTAAANSPSSGTPWSSAHAHSSLPASSPRRRLAQLLAAAGSSPTANLSIAAPGSPGPPGARADAREGPVGAWESPTSPGGGFSERPSAGLAKPGDAAGPVPGSIAAIMSALAQHVNQRSRQVPRGSSGSSPVFRSGEQRGELGLAVDAPALRGPQASVSGMGGQRSPVGTPMGLAPSLLGGSLEQAPQASGVSPRNLAQSAPLAAAAELLEAARCAVAPRAAGEGLAAGAARAGGPSLLQLGDEEGDAAAGALGARGTTPRDVLAGSSAEARQQLSLLLAAAEAEAGCRGLDARERTPQGVSPGDQQRLLAATAALHTAALEAASRLRGAAEACEPRAALPASDARPTLGGSAPIDVQLETLKRALGISGLSEGATPRKAVASKAGSPRAAPDLLAAIAGEIAASNAGSRAGATPALAAQMGTNPDGGASPLGMADLAGWPQLASRAPRGRSESPPHPAAPLHAHAPVQTADSGSAGSVDSEGGVRAGDGRRARGAGAGTRRERRDSSSFSEDSHCEDPLGGAPLGSASGAPSSGGGSPRAGGTGEEDELVPIGALPTGVYFDVARRLWRCQWREDGRLKSSGFSLKHYKTLEAARAACILYKCAMTNTPVDPAWMVPEYIPLSMASKRLVKQRQQASGPHATLASVAGSSAGDKSRGTDEDSSALHGASRRLRADASGALSPSGRGLAGVDEETGRRSVGGQLESSLPRGGLSLGLHLPSAAEGEASPFSPAARLLAGADGLGLEALLAAAAAEAKLRASVKAGACPNSEDPRVLLKLLEEASRQN
ncbi:unnamed protein product [Neospora caninum Liverpool]|uniref:AP2 domain transcription factor AP2VIII-4 n=1 Tax=Neospora caninum (strain Liverpool) TaxID=572307 RepID=F0VIW8_NEOCL|nr:uncharacterized protein NCLIV_034610 [Neospora caninum Liverpool]CBZ53679.1 unnamed protein product [Neospora caninum Liverpool]CEL67670.1 TPA: AP2 domain transcription factor AP2VIII-4 [Neospora caninum Liverpool]|eukprot:XP_003883711.1 uncharacterized protein NCLIV_034610 [Neospora caninum Liverpool]